MSELVQANYRLRPEQRDWLNSRPEGASEAMRAILDDVMAKGTASGALLEERRAYVAGDNLTFTEFVQLHILPRKRDHRISYIRSPAVSDILQNFGRTRSELDKEILRLEPRPLPSPPSPNEGGEVAQHDRQNDENQPA